jgi:hypothetical protein
VTGRGAGRNVENVDGRPLTGALSPAETWHGRQRYQCRPDRRRPRVGSPRLSSPGSAQELGFTLFALDPGYSDFDSGRLVEMDGLFVRHALAEIGRLGQAADTGVS